MEYNDFNVEKAAKSAARHWCSALRLVLAKTDRKMRIKGKMQIKKHSSQTQKVTIYYILFRVSRANSFFFACIRCRQPRQHNTHAHTPT